MVRYSKSIEAVFIEYNNALDKYSKQIKKIGGSGRIHGSIIDIDFFSHVYLNINDGSVTPYVAKSIVDKYVYDTVPQLLESFLPELYQNYLASKESNQDICVLEAIKIAYVSDTSMYRQSKIINSLQYTTNKNVIRLWNDVLFNTGNTMAQELGEHTLHIPLIDKTKSSAPDIEEK